MRTSMGRLKSEHSIKRKVLMRIFDSNPIRPNSSWVIRGSFKICACFFVSIGVGHAEGSTVVAENTNIEDCLAINALERKDEVDSLSCVIPQFMECTDLDDSSDCVGEITPQLREVSTALSSRIQDQEKLELALEEVNRKRQIDGAGAANDVVEQLLRKKLRDTIADAQADGEIDAAEQRAIDRARSKHDAIEQLNNEFDTPNSGNTHGGSDSELLPPDDDLSAHQPGSNRPDGVAGRIRPGFEYNTLDGLAEDINNGAFPPIEPSDPPEASEDSEQTGGNEGATQPGEAGDGTRGGPADDLPEDSPVSNPQRTDPLVIDLDGDGVELTSLGSKNSSQSKFSFY